MLAMLASAMLAVTSLSFTTAVAVALPDGLTGGAVLCLVYAAACAVGAVVAGRIAVRRRRQASSAT